MMTRNREIFKKELEYAKAHIPDLMEEYDSKQGEHFENNPNKWTENYLNKQKTYLMVNFSDKRIEHLLKVCEKIFSENIY